MNTDGELLAWLGPAADEMTDEQMDDFAGMVRDIESVYPHPAREDDGTIPPDDEAEERTEAMSGALQVLLGDATTAEIGAGLMRARAAEASALARAKGAVIAGSAAGISQSQLGRDLGLDRMTVRAVLGL